MSCNKSHQTKLIEMYCENQIMPEFNIDKLNLNNPLQILVDSKIPFTWEVVKENIIAPTRGSIDVRIYMPNNVLYGRHVYAEANDYCNAHNLALANAIMNYNQTTLKPSIKKENNISQEQIKSETKTESIQKVKPEDKPMTAEEIMDIVTGTNKNITKEEPKKDWISFNDADERHEVGHLKNTTQKQAPTKFTQEQIKAMNDFKANFKITSDEMFGSYVNAWNNKLSSKKDIVPANIDSFIQWINTLGKAPY